MAEKPLPPELQAWPGLASPRYTQVPDDLLDLWMSYLSEAELKVLLYIVRRTFGFKKDADAISVRQMQEGIRRADGSVLDYGTGLSLSSVQRGVKGLLGYGLILAERRQSAARGDETTVYQLRLAPLTQIRQPGDRNLTPPPYPNSAPQETAESTNRNGSAPRNVRHEGAVNTLRNALRDRGWGELAIATTLASYRDAGYPPVTDWLARL